MRHRRAHLVEEEAGLSSAFSGTVLMQNDLWSLLLMIFLFAALLSVSLINPKARDIADKRVPGPPTPLEVVIGWSKNQPADVDMWMACQSLVDGKWGDGMMIMYNRRSDTWLDLQRDDLGNTPSAHFEVIRSNSEVKSIPPNTRCWVNAHLYALHGGRLPLEVFASVTLNRNAGDGSEKLFLPEGQKPVEDETGQQWALKVPIFEKAAEVSLFYLLWGADGKLDVNASAAFPNVSPCVLARDKIGVSEKRCWEKEKKQ